MFDELFGRPRYAAGKKCEVCDVRNVSDKWIVGRTVFSDKYFLQRFFIEDIRTEPVDRFGRKGNDVSLCDEFCGPLRGRITTS